MTFARCESLRDINIPSTVLYVGARAFDDCHELPYVDLPRGLLQIGESAFNGCRSLERILIPSTVVAIGPAAFHVCSSLRSVEISIAQNGHGVLEAIGPDAFMHCSSLTNIGIPNNCNVGSGAFPASARCCHKFFEMFIDGRMKDLPKRLKGRFDSLPYHTICYQQGHAGEMATEFTPIVQDYERGSERIKDIFGLTPFHILALSAKPSIAALKMLVEETSMSANGILEFDEWEGYYTQTLTPLRYAIENRAPEALAFIKAMLHVLVDQRTTDLGLELWRSDIVRAINSFEGRDGSERAENVHDLFELLRLYERKEAISLLEQAVWKQRIAQTDRSNEDDDRQGYYLKSGAEIVIPNILPYLGSIEKTLMF
ncbi:unnamed protein product [Cylindrotheca closterium]|uniref:Leucine-rich repeat domain-containing protein n=1 Tax=Cylindrotheca closterium TaxID=2856 RepID=A0AAD2FJI2_9STRA|nr:unnamed protein product [Cylindrotheca closterium]